MKRNRRTGERIIRKLKTAEELIAQGKTVVEDSNLSQRGSPLTRRRQ